MIRRSSFPVLELLLIVVVFAGKPVLAEGELEGEALVRSLRDGGYNIYFRHAQTDWSQQDRIEKAGDWTSCDASRIRQLSDVGRETARSIGDAMRTLGVPVGRVLASPYCRAVETAKEMGLGEVVTTTDVVNLRVAGYFGGREAIVATARRLLSTSPVFGTNTIIVAHGNVAQAATPVYPGEAEGVVFRPGEDGGFGLVGRLTLEQWVGLAGNMER